MVSTGKTLERWRRLLSIQTGQRDVLIVRQRELADKIAAAEVDYGRLESAQHAAHPTLTTEAITADVALRLAAASDRQSRTVAIESVNGVIESLQTEDQKIAGEGVKIQRLITVIETRIDECRNQARHDARRFGDTK